MGTENSRHHFRPAFLMLLPSARHSLSQATRASKRQRPSSAREVASLMTSTCQLTKVQLWMRTWPSILRLGVTSTSRPGVVRLMYLSWESNSLLSLVARPYRLVAHQHLLQHGVPSLHCSTKSASPPLEVRKRLDL